MTLNNDIRKLIIESFLNGHQRKQISLMLDLKYTTVCTVISVYNIGLCFFNRQNRKKKRFFGFFRFSI